MILCSANRVARLFAALVFLGGHSIAAGQEKTPTAESPTEDGAARAAIATVEVASGRRFSGVIDPRTSAQELVLRTEYEFASVTRPIEWSRVVRVTVGDDRYGGGDFRAIASRFAIPSREPPAPLPGDPFETLEDEAPTPVPRSLWADARVANLDRDAEDDGLVVQIVPLDEFGRVAPASGTLRVDLIAKTGVRRPSTAVSSRGPDVQRPVVESWTRQVSAAEFSHNGAFVRLLYAGENPADNPHLHNLGAARVTFTVAGVNQLEAIIDPIRLREVGTIGVLGQ